MGSLALILTAAMLVPPATLPCAKEAKLSALVVEVRSADYRGDRAALARLDQMLGELDDERLAEYRDYWRGFARWRRAQNGFNETPTPADLVADLELARRPLQGLPRAAARLGRGEARDGRLLGQPRLPRRRRRGEEEGDPRRARAGLQVARGERPGQSARPLDHRAACSSRRRRRTGATSPRPRPRCGGASRCPGRRRWRRRRCPAWAPSWGGPENLMNLAYMYSHVPTPDRAAALAYAEGAVDGGARMALRARHPPAADRGAAGGRCRPLS